MNQSTNTIYYNIYSLSQERPQITNELYPPNDFYGHAQILKKYAGIPETYQIKAVIQHAALLAEEQLWNQDINSSLPTIFTYSRREFELYKNITNKILIPIGPLLSYAEPLLTSEELKAEKERLKDNLLIFPSHSSHKIRAKFNLDNFCQKVKEIGEGFNKIRICLYWKDIQLGFERKFLEYGFETVTAGHLYDPLFLPRLKSIIETATVTASNHIGTHIGYCVMSKKPHYLFECGTEFENADNCQKLFYNFPQQFKKVFSSLRMDITGDQYQIVNKYWGLENSKSPLEIKDIISITEEIYQYQNKSKVEQRKKYIELLLFFKKLTAEGKKIVVFGNGKASEIILPYLPLNIAYFVDNNKDKWGESFQKLLIKDPQVLQKEDKSQLAILVASSFYEEISNQLITMGYQENIHFWNLLNLYMPFLDFL